MPDNSAIAATTNLVNRAAGRQVRTFIPLYGGKGFIQLDLPISRVASTNPLTNGPLSGGIVWVKAAPSSSKVVPYPGTFGTARVFEAARFVPSFNQRLLGVTSNAVGNVGVRTSLTSPALTFDFIGSLNTSNVLSIVAPNTYSILFTSVTNKTPAVTSSFDYTTGFVKGTFIQNPTEAKKLQRTSAFNAVVVGTAAYGFFVSGTTTGGFEIYKK